MCTLVAIDITFYGAKRSDRWNPATSTMLSQWAYNLDTLRPNHLLLEILQPGSMQCSQKHKNGNDKPVEIFVQVPNNYSTGEVWSVPFMGLDHWPNICAGGHLIHLKALTHMEPA